MMAKKNDRRLLRIRVNIDPVAHPEIYDEIERIDTYRRADRLRHLAQLGLHAITSRAPVSIDAPLEQPREAVMKTSATDTTVSEKDIGGDFTRLVSEMDGARA